MVGMMFKPQNKSLCHFLSFRNKLTPLPLKTYVLRYSTCRSPSRGLIMVMFKSRCTSIWLNASLASSSDLAPIMSSKLLSANVVRTLFLDTLNIMY